MTVPLTFEIGNNSFLFYSVLSFISRLTEWKPIYDETTITLAVNHHWTSAIIIIIIVIFINTSSFSYVFMTLIKPNFSACFHMKCKTITAVKIAKT